MIPSSSENLGASRCGFDQRMSGNSSRSSSFVSNSVLICLRNALAIGREVRKNADRDLGIVQYVLNGEAESNQRTLSMLTAPKIEIAIWSRLYLATAREVPITVEVGSV